MRLFWRRKSRWERAIEPLSHIDGRAATRSGLTAAAGVIGLAAASALLSSFRRRDEGS